MRAGLAFRITAEDLLVTVYHACASRSFRTCKPTHITLTSRANLAERHAKRGGSRKRTKAMKTILSALVALSVLAAVAPASAAEFDSNKFWQQQGNRY